MGPFSWITAGPRPQPRAGTADIHLLHKRLAHARLAKLLRRMHVSENTYLQRLHPDVVAAQLDMCAACPHQFQCNQALACERTSRVDLAFCPNYEPVAALRRAA